MKFEFLKCIGYAELEKFVKEFNVEHDKWEDDNNYDVSEPEYLHIEQIKLGQSIIGNVFYLLRNDEEETKASFSLSGNNSNGYILRCVSVDGEFSADGQYHS